MKRFLLRVKNNATNCIKTDNSFNVVINPLPKAEVANNIIKCDDNSVGDDKDGFISTFDLSSQTATILGNQDPNLFEVLISLKSKRC